ncbi:glycoside hydrolase family 43 protein [Paenibacillus endoradicis]|uniref:glycoside hydrolase family 43 protein n=1 Tax=Paenibacillus endoradicis TaxID=2972487 RepID=UPI0021597391|nr:glycoside hydrolase family 43 protein [Paenibacillus endoradicis]MCR8659352.1 glycoside hydrolase family 43 protein [Paenibacillus endoradicis]
MKLSNIQIRDPFIVPRQQEQKYYMYGSTDKNIWQDGNGFEMYVSENLEDWDGPYEVFRNYEGFISDKNFWAPEVYEYDDAFYMFATFRRRENDLLGTAVLKSDSLYGPFELHSDGVVTPKDWCCLDGSLYVDDHGIPWMVFCHEWQQVGDGEVCIIQLSHDLSKAVSEPQLLFKASEAKWPTSFKHERVQFEKNYVTDGSYMFKNEAGELCMLWASFIDQQYAQGLAKSLSGEVIGPWIHRPEPIYSEDGGHGMIFKTFEGETMLALHGPNQSPNERAKFISISL